jgi:serine/threonine-protein kinase PknG
VRLRKVRANLDLGDPAAAAAELDAVLPLVDPDDWRVPWYRGLTALAAGRPAQAWADFDAVYDALPGELAPKLALAVTAEHTNRPIAAARYYDLVWRTDHSFVSAAFGLARVRLAAGEQAAAVAVLESVPETSSHHVSAQVAAVRARIGGGVPSQSELITAASRLTQIKLDAVRLSMLRAEVLERALEWVRANQGSAGSVRVLDCPLTEPDLRFGLERTYRALARLTDSTPDRIALVDRANTIRPRTLV